MIRELELEPGVDTLAKWMAHYIAELITASESAETEAEQRAAQHQCADTIMRLWAHRCALGERRPLASFEPILRTLESLDPERPARYFSRPDDRQNSEWLTIAEGVDRTARLLIDLAVRMAALEAQGKERDWVELASGAIRMGDRELEVVLSLIERGEEVVTETNDEQTNEWLSAQKERLEQFAEVAGAFAGMLDELQGR